MAYSETIQQVSAEAGYEVLIAEAKAIPTNFSLNRDRGELNERLLALGIALSAKHGLAKHGLAMNETEKKDLALGFITGVILKESNFEESVLDLSRAILTDF